MDFGHAGKWLEKKAKINFKIYDATKWITKGYSKHMTRYFKKYMQSDNKIWSVGRK